MAWYWIVLIVLAALFGLLFLAYMTNADMKLIEKIYNALIACLLYTSDAANE